MLVLVFVFYREYWLHVQWVSRHPSEKLI